MAEAEPFLGKSGDVPATSPPQGAAPENKESKEAVVLKKQIGLFSGCGVVIGVMVGSGIFVSPTDVLSNVGSGGLSLVIWLACGLYSLLGALSYTELGSMITKSGGDYTYILEAFGPLTAFVFLWINLIVVIPTVLALIGITCGTYVLVPFFTHSSIPEVSARLTGASIVLVLILINCLSVKMATWISNIATVGKIGALVMIIVSAIVYMARGHTENFGGDFFTENINYSPGALALGFYAGVFSYSGWNYLNFLSEELKQPQKNLPRTLYISIPLVTIIYLLVNVSYLAVLTPIEMANSKVVASAVAERVLGPVKHAMPVVVVMSCIGTLNGMLFACSRMFFVAARNGHLPELFSMIHPKLKTPIPSVILLGFLGILMHFAKDLSALIIYVSFGQTSIVLMAVLGLVKMRFTDKDRPRPIKIFIGIPILFIAISVFILVCPFFQQPMQLLFVSIAMVSGVPVYFVFVYWKKPAILMKPWVWMTHGIQATLLCLPQDARQD